MTKKTTTESVTFYVNQRLKKYSLKPKNRMSFGTLLRKNRDHCKLTGSEIADLLGVSQGTYHNWESNKTNLPAKYLPQLAEIFKVNVIELIPKSSVPKSPEKSKLGNQEKPAADAEAIIAPLELYQKLLESKEEVIMLQKEEIKRLQIRIDGLKK